MKIISVVNFLIYRCFLADEQLPRFDYFACKYNFERHSIRINYFFSEPNCWSMVEYSQHTESNGYFDLLLQELSTKHL